MIRISTSLSIVAFPVLCDPNRIIFETFNPFSFKQFSRINGFCYFVFNHVFLNCNCFNCLFAFPVTSASILPTTASISFSLSACERMSPVSSSSQRDMSWSTLATMRRCSAREEAEMVVAQFCVFRLCTVIPPFTNFVKMNFHVLSTLAVNSLKFADKRN